MVSEIETIAAPATEPLTLIDAKAHLRVDHDDEDDAIAAMALAAREAAEDFTRNRLITQTVRLTFDTFGRTIRLPVWPVQSVLSVVYDDAEGVERTLDPASYTLIKRKPREIGPAYSAVWPATRPHWGAVRVTLIVGYGATGGQVPQPILSAMKMMLGSFYRDREANVIGVSNSEISGLSAVRSLLSAHVLWV